MALYAIGDLHLSLGGNKAMDAFPGWEGYVQQITDNWLRLVTPNDTVVLAGDTSWAMQLDECAPDFSFIHKLPGNKILLKGNHDYWWSTLTRMNEFVAANGYASFSFLNNNCFVAENTAICGTRGWMFEAGEEHNTKIIARETGRLRNSLACAAREYPQAEPVVFLHYPPIYGSAQVPEFIAVLHEYGVRRCYYGHLHGDAIRYAFNGAREGVEYRLISADYLRFMPQFIA